MKLNVNILDIWSSDDKEVEKIDLWRDDKGKAQPVAKAKKKHEESKSEESEKEKERWNKEEEKDEEEKNVKIEEDNGLPKIMESNKIKKIAKKNEMKPKKFNDKRNSWIIKGSCIDWNLVQAERLFVLWN